MTSDVEELTASLTRGAPVMRRVPATLISVDVYRPAAARGARFLDAFQSRPWRPEVDPFGLDLGDEYRCVLGQLYGSYGHGVDALLLGPVSATYYGFQVMACQSAAREAWDALTEAWRHELTPA